MYRILVVSKFGENIINNQYKWLTSVNSESGEAEIYEAETLEEIDAKVEEMINGNYSKNSFIVVKQISYNVSSDIAEETVSE